MGDLLKGFEDKKTEFDEWLKSQSPAVSARPNHPGSVEISLLKKVAAASKIALATSLGLSRRRLTFKMPFFLRYRLKSASRAPPTLFKVRVPRTPRVLLRFLIGPNPPKPSYFFIFFPTSTPPLRIVFFLRPFLPA
jgi:hypothetical protein